MQFTLDKVETKSIVLYVIELLTGRIHMDKKKHVLGIVINVVLLTNGFHSS